MKAADTVNINVVPRPVKTITFEDVYFDFDRYSLTDAAQRILAQAVKRCGGSDAAHPHRRPHVQHRHGRVQPGAWRSSRTLGAAVPRVERHRGRSIDHCQLRRRTAEIRQLARGNPPAQPPRGHDGTARRRQLRGNVYESLRKHRPVVHDGRPRLAPRLICRRKRSRQPPPRKAEAGTSVNLGSVNIPRAVKADGKALAAGTYQVRVTETPAAPPLPDRRRNTSAGRSSFGAARSWAEKW